MALFSFTTHAFAKTKPSAKTQAQDDAARFRRRATDRAPTERRIRQLYERPASFTNLLPWLEYCPQTRCFLLDDGYSVAALFEIGGIGTEGRTTQYIAELRDKLQTVLTSIAEELDSPWIFQLFLQDEPSLLGVVDEVERYLDPRAQQSELSENYLTILHDHLQTISQTGGAFDDKMVTGGPWRGQRRRIRATLYRRRKPAKNAGTHDYYHLPPEEELNDAAAKLTTAFATAGIRLTRLGGKELYDWMFRWFNPRPAVEEGDSEAVLRNVAPYPGDDEMPFGYAYAETLMLGMPHSDADRGIWWFDGMPHKTVTVQGLRKIPDIGLFGAERSSGDHVYAMFDRMPEETILAMTLVVAAQDLVRNHLGLVQHGSVGDYPEAKLAAQDAEKAVMEIAKGNKLLPVQLAVYVRGDDEPDLHRKINKVNSLLLSNGLQPIMERDDLIPLDSYLRNLPMGYQYDHDKREARRSRLIFSKHCANLMPVYGRSTGSGHPGLLFFNRGAEPLMLDPLNPQDRKKNAHALIIGPTGAGKSATLVYMILQMMAVYRPRIFIIEAGNSFGLLGQYLASQGVTTNRVSMLPGADVSLPPFSEALKLLDQKNLDFDLHEDNDLDDDPYNDFDNEDIEDDNRDLLGEMEIAARIMITGGDVREDNRMTRADRLLIRRAIHEAAKNVKEAGRNQVLTEDVVQALRNLEGLADRRRERVQDMADGMELFCSGLAGHFFNRPGVRWPDVDFTWVDMGILAREGYEDQLTVAYIGLMNHIHDLVERHQNDARPTIVITDEGHIITTNPLLAPYVIKIVKMWRKLGAWFWIATQNLEDFPDASKKMLNMLEWWFCLVMPKEEVEHIARFRDLRDEEKNMLLAARKSPKHFTEGVVLTDEQAMLFRIVPPPLALALAMTEKDEKANRARIMKQNGCSEIEAVEQVAKEISFRRREEIDDQH
ncbi:conjugative transfer ATPase [Methylotuvimicrobium sp. KM1]|uniref:conjugative transfer ATPase n=1 Tax=Methylotuvimicrobium sp. KM1 TaxID=3377707 RepID=UPI00384D9DDE